MCEATTQIKAKLVGAGMGARPCSYICAQTAFLLQRGNARSGARWLLGGFFDNYDALLGAAGSCDPVYATACHGPVNITVNAS